MPPPMHHRNLPQVHPSNDTIFFRGLHNSLKPDDIREFFMEEFGDCTIAFFKQADNEDKLFIALQFKNGDMARQVINKYDDNLVLGSRVQLSWYKDFRKAKQQGIIPPNNRGRQDRNFNNNTRGGRSNYYPRQYPRGRRDSRSRGRDRSRSGSFRSGRSFDSRSPHSGPSRSVSPGEKARKRKHRSVSSPRRASTSRSRSGSLVRKSAVSSRSGSKASRSPPARPPIESPPRRRSPPVDSRRREQRGGSDNKVGELADEPDTKFVVHRTIDRGRRSDDEDRGGVSDPKERSRNNGGAFPKKFKSSFKEEDPPRREAKGADRSMERHDMDEDEDMNDSPAEKGGKAKPSKPKKNKRKKKEKSPSRTSSKRSLTPDQEDDSHLPAEAQNLLLQKRGEIEKSYKQDCETFATVVNMLISKDASLKEALRFSLEENLKEIGDRCLGELRQYRQKMASDYS